MSETPASTVLPFQHRQYAHCESGVTSSLLTNRGRALSEPMAFGVASGLTFAYIPLIKMGGLPLFAYRMPPKAIFKGVSKRLGVKMAYETFSSPEEGMRRLDEHLAAGRVVGLQTSVYWLDYFPPDMRFHFNAHNLVVYGKKDGKYQISDPVIDFLVECEPESLKKARFVKGALAPKGLLYYPSYIPERFDLGPAIKKSIDFTTGMMLHTPLPFIGVRGIRYVSKMLRKLKSKDTRLGKLTIGHMVRMQEEIGTGGAGFRFLYASFLQEAAQALEAPELAKLSAELTAAGDQWRQFALWAAKMCKDRMPLDFDKLGDQLLVCADLEEQLFKKLRVAGKQLP